MSTNITELQDQIKLVWYNIIMPCELVRRQIPSCSSKFDVKIENLEILDVGDYDISEMITTTETWVAPFGNVTLPVVQSENETSNIFYRFGDIRPEARALNAIIYLYYGVRTRSTYHIRVCSMTRINRKIVDVGDYNISETITVLQRRGLHRFVAWLLHLPKSENGTRISLTVSEIFDRKREPWTRYFFILIIIHSFRQKLVHVSPPTGMVRSWKFRHHIKARDRTKTISDFGGKIPTRWFPMGEI